MTKSKKPKLEEVNTSQIPKYKILIFFNILYLINNNVSVFYNKHLHRYKN